MKSAETRAEFIQLRASGLSYAKIAERLHISKATCQSWERNLTDKIAEAKRERLEELTESYTLTKEARIRKLGETLNGINRAIADIDYSTLSPEKLLDYSLKYTEALKAEYMGYKPAFGNKEAITDKGILHALGDLLNRTRAGDITTEQASREAAVLTQLLKAYENTELKAKINELESILQRGQAEQ